MFYVADGDSALLSYETAIYPKILNEVNSVEDIHAIIDKNVRDISHGIGTYKGAVVKLHIDESVLHAGQPHTDAFRSACGQKLKTYYTNPADYMSRHPTVVQLLSHVNNTTCHHYRMDLGWMSALISKYCSTASRPISWLSLMIIRGIQ